MSIETTSLEDRGYSQAIEALSDALIRVDFYIKLGNQYAYHLSRVMCDLESALKNLYSCSDANIQLDTLPTAEVELIGKSVKLLRMHKENPADIAGLAAYYRSKVEILIPCTFLNKSHAR